jgi:predicted metal-dependent peptidase
VDPALEAKAREKLTIARISLLLNNQFFGTLATRLKLVESSEWCKTLATDSKNFYFNSAFVDTLRPKELIFGFAHEIMHCVYDHMNRRHERDPSLWNIAADFCINGDLVRHRIGELITTIKILHDPKYAGKSAEEVYDELMKNADKINMKDLLSQVFDDHLDGDDDGDGNGDTDKDGKPRNGAGRPKFTDSEKKEMQDAFKEAVISAAQNCDAGSIPEGVKRMIDELTAPKMNWRDLLQQQIQSIIKSDFTWMRPNRKSQHYDAILPGMKNAEMISVAISIDLSGSIDGVMQRDFLSEVKGIMDQYPEYEIDLWTFDTQCYNHKRFTADNGDELLEYEMMGGGGTSFEANWEFMKENGIEPKRFIMFTDGYPCGGWGDPDYCDTVFILHNNDKSLVAPFGISAHYDATN